MALITGVISKLKATHAEPIQYFLPIGETSLPLNEGLGKKISLRFLGKIHCLYCKQVTKKSYSQGYCFPCSQRLARCDFCIVRPEKCHYRLGTCREPDWALSHCFIPHIIYLANTSDLKVGITRQTQLPNRWIDQGATQALPIIKVKDRYQSGLIEVKLKKSMNDKTNWRKMLMGQSEPIDLLEKKNQLLMALSLEEGMELILDHKITNLHYPILEYPKKVIALNFEKTPEIEGKLLGIKGQYLILDNGVLNIRNLSGFNISVGIN